MDGRPQLAEFPRWRRAPAILRISASRSYPRRRGSEGDQRARVRGRMVDMAQNGIRRERVVERGQRSRPVVGEGGRRSKPRRSGGGGVKQLPWRQPVNRYPAVEVLSADALEAIHDASMRLLETQGLE